MPFCGIVVCVWENRSSLENRVWRGDRRGQTLFVLTEMVCKKRVFNTLKAWTCMTCLLVFQ